MIVTSTLHPHLAAAFAPTLLYLWQTPNPGESDGANWWFWLLLLLLLIVLVWWLLGRKAPESASSANEHTLPPVDLHPADAHTVDPVVASTTLDPAPPVITVPSSPPPASITPDNLIKIEGIGPKINEILHGAGIHTFAELAQTDVERLRAILLQAGLRVNDPATWPEQAALAAAGKWEELQTFQAQLGAGRRAGMNR